MRRRRWRTVVLATVIVALYGVATAVVVDRARAPSAAELLARAQRFVRAAHTVVIDGHVQLHASDVDATLQSHGEVVFPDRYHVVVSVAPLDEWSEELTVGGQTWVRGADDRAGLRDEKWAELPGAPGGIIAPGAGTGLSQIGPSGLRRLVLAARAPAVVTNAGGTAVLTARFSGGTVRLTMATGGRVDRMVLSGSSGGARIRTDVRLSRWDSRQRIEPPATADVDDTPGLDEEKVLAYRDAPLLQPRGIPQGWELDGATVVPASDAVEGCREVELDYVDPEHDDGYLTLYELPPGCPDYEELGGAPFTVAGHQGVVTQEDGETRAEVRIDGTILQAETDLPPGDLAVVLRELLPLDFDVHPVPLPGLGGSSRPA